MKEKALVQAFAIAIATAAVILLLSFFISSSYMHFPGIHKSMIKGFFGIEFISLKILVSIVNSVLLFYLLYNYISIYNEIKSEFSLGLIALITALFAYSITSNPVTPLLFGFKGAGLGPFTLIPSLFTLGAALILTYLSTK